MHMLADWCARGAGGVEIGAPVSLRTLYAFYTRFAGGDGAALGDWNAIVALLQEAVAAWEVEVRRSEARADVAVAAKLAQLRGQAGGTCAYWPSLCIVKLD